MKSLRDIHRAAFPAAELLIGMGLAHAIATLQVYASNHRLFNQMAAVAAAGFLPVPTPGIIPRLIEVETAFWGGLLFTLSIGAGLALASVALAWLWPRGSSFRRAAALIAFGLQAAALLLMNSSGFDLWVSLYFILIPPPVFWMTLRFCERTDRRPDRQILAWRALPLAAIALAWSAQYDSHLFIDLRDHLLMSSPAGRNVSAFYYRYTLYPAEALKSLDQRLIKTIAWPGPEAEARHPGLRRELIRADYLPVENVPAVDLGLAIRADRLVFTRNAEPLWEVDTERFFADPRAVMSDLSKASDRWPPFRAFTYAGVLLAFPIALYLLLFALLRLVFGVFSGERKADALAAAGCLLIGLGLLFHFHFSREAAPPPEEWGAVLHSPRWQKRVAALREIHARKGDIFAISDYAPPLLSPYPQERYWLARALGTSPNPEAPAHLLRLLDDPQLNVQTMALEGLAQRRDRFAANQILRRLKNSQDWYFQMYAYRALRALGWNQTVSR